MLRHRILPLSLLALLPLSLTACGGGGGSDSGGSPPGLGAFTLTALAGDTTTNLTWTAPTVPAGAHLTGYDVKRSTDPNTPPATVVASVGPNVTSYADTQATVGTTYFYKITARADSGVTLDSSTPPPLPSPVPASGSALPYSDSATPGGPAVLGLGDPAVCAGGPCQPPDALFQSADYEVTTSPSASPPTISFTLALRLNRAASKTDLQAVQFEGAVFNRTNTPGFDAGLTIPNPATPQDPNSVQFDSVKAGVSLPAQYVPLKNGAAESLTAFVSDGGTVKRLEITGSAVVQSSGAGRGGSGVTIAPPDNRQFTFGSSYAN